MPALTLTATGQLLARLTAFSIAALALSLLWMSRYQPVEMDLAMLHYCAFLINEKGLLLYRDIFENNLPGPFLLHAMIGKAFGYGAVPVRLLDGLLLFGLAACSWQILRPLSLAAAVTAPALFAIVYFAGGTTAAFQRDYIATLPLAAALALLCRNTGKPLRDALLVGALCGIACSLKPNMIVMGPAFFWILLQRLPGSVTTRSVQLLPLLGIGFLLLFAIPLLWALRHADLAELVHLYQTYTPVYVSTRTDLFHYDNAWQQWRDLLAMQASHLGRLSLMAIPGLLWAWRQWRGDVQAMCHLRCLAIALFAIAWHEMVAGKFWFAHLLPPYFFALLCFTLLLTPAAAAAGNAEKSLRILLVLPVVLLTFLAGTLSWQRLHNAGYDAENAQIRSKKIARYLQQHLQPGDKVQALDGSGDGQGSLLLAGAVTATRFVEDIPLYLQPHSPVTQGFRREFIDTLTADPPAFIVYIHNFFHPAGGNRLQEFTELDSFIKQYYEVAVLEDGEYTIFRRR